MWGRRWILSAGVCGLLAAAAGPARAQDAADAALGSGLRPSIETIVVTAERREQDVQDVPAAVSTFTPDLREEIGIEDLEDIALFTPGMSLRGDYIMLRGVGRLTGSLGTEPGVPIYADGFYDSNAAVLDLSPIFQQRTEILRGPQGTLYGRNSIGGAANIVSARPTDTFESAWWVTAGNFETIDNALVVAGPLTDDLGFRLGVQQDWRGEGFVENAFPGEGDGSDRGLYVEGQLAWSASPSLDVWLKVSHRTGRGKGSLSNRIDPYNTATPTSAHYDDPIGGGPGINPGVADPYRTNHDDPFRYRLDDNDVVTAHVTWDLGAATLRYVGGWGTYDAEFEVDGDGTGRASFTTSKLNLTAGCFYDAVTCIGAGSFALFETPSRLLVASSEEKTWWSNEVLLMSPEDQSLRWLLGLYQSRDHVEQPFAIQVPGGAEFATPLQWDLVSPAAPNPDRNFFAYQAELEADSYAVFGQLDWDFLDRWTATLGLRHTWDEKDGAERLQTYTHTGYAGFLVDGRPLVLDNGAGERRLSGSWRGVTGRAGLSWRPSDATMVYGNVSVGYKSGGFNLGTLSPLPEVDEESVVGYEVGLKHFVRSDVLGELLLNAAAFHYDYDDQQIIRAVNTGTGVCPGAAPDCVVLETLAAVPESRSRGVELESTWAPTPNLRAIVSYTYLDAEVEEYSAFDVNEPALGNQNLAGARMQNAPEHKYTANLAYTLPRVGPGSLTLSGTYVWVGRQYFAPFNHPNYAAPSWDEVDLRALWRRHDGNLDVIAYVANVTDDVHYRNVSYTEAGRTVELNPPRTYGLQARMFFR